jgi:hypothetical protein
VATINNLLTNSIPIVTGVPPLLLIHPETVSILIQAVDNDGDNLTYAVAETSLGMVYASMLDDVLTFQTAAPVSSTTTVTFTVQVGDGVSTTAIAVRAHAMLKLGVRIS